MGESLIDRLFVSKTPPKNKNETNISPLKIRDRPVPHKAIIIAEIIADNNKTKISHNSMLRISSNRIPIISNEVRYTNGLE
jgi:hypothetical protein